MTHLALVRGTTTMPPPSAPYDNRTENQRNSDNMLWQGEVKAMLKELTVQQANTKEKITDVKETLDDKIERVEEKLDAMPQETAISLANQFALRDLRLANLETRAAKTETQLEGLMRGQTLHEGGLKGILGMLANVSIIAAAVGGFITFWSYVFPRPPGHG